MAISVDEQIRALKNEEALRAELISFLMKHYEREYKKVNMQKDISFEQKAFFIRRYKGKISQLKKGELVAFNS
ncbi:MAG: DNA primase, partial [Sulfurimonas sp.]|nr:DNA primase [Sulfurimonas sp.]